MRLLHLRAISDETTSWSISWRLFFWPILRNSLNAHFGSFASVERKAWTRTFSTELRMQQLSSWLSKKVQIPNTVRSCVFYSPSGWFQTLFSNFFSNAKKETTQLCDFDSQNSSGTNPTGGAYVVQKTLPVANHIMTVSLLRNLDSFGLNS